MKVRSKLGAGALAAAAAAVLMTAGPALAQAPSGSTAQGIVSSAGRSQLCVTADSLNAESRVNLNVCQVASDAKQEWSLLWIKFRKNSTSGPFRMCLTAHPNLCLGVGHINKRLRLANAVLYDDSNGDPSVAIENALTLFRASTGGQQYRIGANAIKGGARLTTQDGRAPRFGDHLVWRIPTPSFPTLYVLPRFHKPKN